MRGHLDVCLAILARSDFSRVNTKDRHGSTALHAAAHDGFLSVVSAILSWPDLLNVNDLSGQGWTALQAAARNGHYLVCELLVRRPDIDLNFESAHGWTATLLVSNCCNALTILGGGSRSKKSFGGGRSSNKSSIFVARENITYM